MTYPPQYPPQYQSQPQPGYPQGYPQAQPAPMEAMPGPSPGFAPGYPSPMAPPQAFPPNAGANPATGYPTVPAPNQAPVQFQQPPQAFQPGPGYPPAPGWQQPPQGYQPPPVQPYNPYGQPQQGYQQFQQPAQPQYQPQAPQQSFSLSDFYDQPNGAAGPSLTKLVPGLPNNQWPDGTEWIGVVAREVTDGDVFHQTAMSRPGEPVRYLYNKDGTPKLGIQIPLHSVQLIWQGQLVPSPAHPDGSATRYIQRNARDEWARARGEAGCPAKSSGKAGEVIRCKLVGRRSIPGFGQPANEWQFHVTPVAGQEQQQNGQAQQQVPPGMVQYDNWPPQLGQQSGPIANTPAQVTQQWAPVAQAAAQQPQQPGYPDPWGQQSLVPPAQANGGPAGQPGQPQPPPPQQQQSQGLTPPGGMSPGQQALLAQLAGQQAQG